MDWLQTQRLSISRATGIAVSEFMVAIPWGGLAPLIGTSIYTNTALSWRWIYIIMIVIAVVAFAGTALFYFPPARPAFDLEKSRLDQVRELDYVGCLLFAGGITSVLLALSWGGTQKPWRSAATIAPLVAGIGGITAAVVYDITMAQVPLLPKVLLVQFRDYTVLLFVAFFTGTVFYAMAALLPAAGTYIFTNDLLEVSIMQIPNGMGQIILGVVATAFVGRIGHLKIQLIFYMLMMTVFIGCLAASLHNKAAFMALQFFAMGTFPTVSTICFIIAGLNIPLRHLGTAIGLIGTFRSAGGSAGTSILFSILNSTVQDKLAASIVGAALPLGFSASEVPSLIQATVLNAVGVPGAFLTVQGITPLIQEAVTQALVEVYIVAFQRVFYACTAFGLVGIIFALLVRDPSKYLTNHTAVHLGPPKLEPSGNDQANVAGN